MIWTPEWKQEQLEALEDEWINCQGCELHEERTNIVFGEGNPDADIMFIGEAPGEAEDEEGRPFVGRSGEYLQDMFDAMKILREDIYITNIIMCRPPDNRDPRKDEKLACFERLRKQIYIVDPMLLILLGRQAMQMLIGTRHKSIESAMGKVLEAKIEGEHFHLTYPAMVVYHPAFMLRNDIIDPDTKKWQVGGYSQKTFMAIEDGLRMVRKTANHYERVQRRG